MTDPTLCQPLRLAEPITGGPFRRGGRFSPATWRKFSVQLASLIRYMHLDIAEMHHPPNAPVVTILRYHWNGTQRTLEDSL